ncbi:MAG: hypothetical protein ACFHU9_12225 [Fluviicola sp.]
MSTPNTDDLKRLFEFVRPNQLRSSIEESLFAYLLSIDEKAFPKDFKQVIEDHYFLIQFLSKTE